MEFFCIFCNNDYKTRKGLNQHKNTASHKRKVDPEFAAAEEAEKSANKELNSSAGGDEFFCSVCDTGHDFKTLLNLNQHEKRASHKRKVDPEFAAAEELIVIVAADDG